jgi:hypothetical protein
MSCQRLMQIGTDAAHKMTQNCPALIHSVDFPLSLVSRNTFVREIVSKSDNQSEDEI